MRRASMFRGFSALRQNTKKLRPGGGSLDRKSWLPLEAVMASDLEYRVVVQRHSINLALAHRGADAVGELYNIKHRP